MAIKFVAKGSEGEKPTAPKPKKKEKAAVVTQVGVPENEVSPVTQGFTPSGVLTFFSGTPPALQQEAAHQVVMQEQQVTFATPTKILGSDLFPQGTLEEITQFAISNYPSVTSLELGVVVDLLGLIGERLKAVKPLLKLHDELKKRLLSEAREATSPENSHKALTFSGSSFTASISPCRNETEYTTPQAVYELVGPDIFWSIIGVKGTEVSKYCSPDQIASISKKKAGARSVEAVVRT